MNILQMSFRRYLQSARIFANLHAKLFKEILKASPLRVFLVMVLDLIGAASRIEMLAILSFVVSVFRNPRIVHFGDHSLALSPSVPFLAAASFILFLVLAIGALASYGSAWLARKQGRAVHTECLRQCERIMGLPPHRIAIPAYLPGYGLNKLLTQICMHRGLAAETLLRLIYPAILMLLSLATVFYLNPKIAAFLVLLGLVIMPLYLALSARVHGNAQEFYGPSSSKMGAAVSRYAHHVDSQHGLASEQARPPLLPSDSEVMRTFMDDWDRNLLANNLMSLFIALMSGVVLPLILFYLGYMVMHGQLSPNALIPFAGAFLYMISSVQTVVSYGTNLLRFFPQVRRHDLFVSANAGADEAREEGAGREERWPHRLTLRLAEPTQPESLKRAVIEPGSRTAIYGCSSISKLTFPQTVSPLLAAGLITPAMVRRAVFVNARYSFVPDTLEKNLLGTQTGEDAGRRLRTLLEHFGLSEEFDRLPAGLQTRMSNDVWNRLSGPARAALRLIPIMMIEGPKLVFLDVGVVQNLNPGTFDHVFAPLHDSYIFITLPEKKCPSGLASLFLVIENGRISGAGDHEWFNEKVEKIAVTDSGGPAAMELESTLI